MTTGMDTVLIPVTSEATPARGGRNPMVAVNDIPLLQFALNEAVATGASRIIVVAEAGDTATARFLSSRPVSRDGADDFFTARMKGRVPGNVSLKLVERREPLGFAGSLVDAYPHLGGDRIGIIRIEDFVLGEQCLSEMLRAPLTSPLDTIVGAVPKAEDTSDRQTLRTGDEGAPLTPIGRFILPLDVVDALSQQAPNISGRRSLGEAIKAVGALNAWPVSSTYFDCSTREGLFEASAAIRARRRTTRPLSIAPTE